MTDCTEDTDTSVLLTISEPKTEDRDVLPITKRKSSWMAIGTTIDGRAFLVEAATKKLLSKGIGASQLHDLQYVIYGKLMRFTESKVVNIE